MGGRGHHKKDGPRTCRSCDKVFDTARGFPQHEKACSKAKALAEQSQKAYLEIQQEQSGQEGRKRKKRRLRRSLDEPAGMQHSTAPPFAEGSSGENLHDPLDYADHQASPSGGADAAGTGSTRGKAIPNAQLNVRSNNLFSSAASPPPHNSAESTAPTPRREPEPLPAGQSPNINDVKVEYHPQSGRESCTYSFYNYANDQQSVVLEEGDPWKPFSSRDDYEFANIVLQAGMKQEQVDCLFDIIRRKCKNESDLTFGSYKDVEAAWNQAGSQYPGFKKDEVTVEYLKTDLTYEVLYRDTQELVKLMLEDPKLSPHFKWDARRTYKWDGQQWEQFWEPEPTSGSYMWDVQSQTPEGGTPLGIYLYADKNKLSSFGTQKGYPVIMRITNLDADVRHGPGLGGGHVVGFLPDVGDPAEHSGKTSWANHKRAVWHAAMEKIIKPLLPEDYDVDCGMTVKCGDHKTRCFYTFMNIFAGDYEEQ
ncbi:hypothetical protein PsYK624_169270 [Phanerochaete sordida]|uniref:Uncharacterized protein n=1 Tax=Phanerochaete sordida TaxID=48140 RepID=A0A9P3LPE0_9APHY|nr:hypothetical protein PsYK624_169270 [Phanerochaete sordida]